MNVAVREANPGDFAGIMSLIKSNRDTFGEHEVPVAEKSIIGLISSTSKEHMFFVDVDSGKIVGCCGFSKQEDTSGVYMLCWLAIHPDFKRKGIATNLYELIEGRVRKLKGRLIALNAGSGEVNRQFYRKMGFRKVGRIPKYYSESKDLLWYYKPL